MNTLAGLTKNEMLMKTPHEQCAEEIKPCPFCGKAPTIKHAGRTNYWWVGCEIHLGPESSGCGVSHSSYDKENAIQKWNTRFPQPTSIPSLDEVVENPKAQPSIYGLLSYLQYQYPATCGDIQLRDFCNGLLARHASLVAEVERLEKKIETYFSDYKIWEQERAGLNLTITKLKQDCPWPSVVSDENTKLRTQLSTADRISQLTAHRACGNQEQDPQNGKLAGYCIVCQVPWPCDIAKPK